MDVLLDKELKSNFITYMFIYDNWHDAEMPSFKYA